MAESGTRVCRNCGRSADEHCAFAPIVMPPSCMCEPAEWDIRASVKAIPPVCAEYIGRHDRCDRCEHDKACHVSENPLGAGPGDAK